MAVPTDGFDNGDDTGTPRWVKVFGIIVLVVVLLFVILMLTRGPAGHGPGRHGPLGVSRNQAPGVIEDQTPSGGHAGGQVSTEVRHR
jgi:hypothetical protein